MARRHTSPAPMLLGGVAFLSLVIAAAPAPARACGGFFCSSVPVVQAGEEIVYVIDPDGSLTMSVRILYTGPAPEFAWILPVPETPEISLGAPALFDQLRSTTAPRFYVARTTVEGTCRERPACVYPPPPTIAYHDAASVGADASAGPTIYLESTLGPYETVVLGGTSATEIHDWLSANGYDLPAASIPVLDDYVAAGQRFVALRLRNDASSSEIQPVTLRFGGVLPCLPIRLTAIATAPSLPITAYFLADARATPRNYSLVESPFPARLWDGRVSYEGWVASETDALGGRAFIADYAGATPSVSIRISSALDLASSPSPEHLMQQLIARNLARDPQMMPLLLRFLAPPPGLDALGYYNCLARSFGGSCGTPASFDPAGLAAAIEETIVLPRDAAQRWVDEHDYTTRLFTTMSADEMTVDPEFVIDPGLGDVSNEHPAEEIIECDAHHFREDAPSRLVLPDGRTARFRSAESSESAEGYCERRGGRDAGSCAIARGRGTLSPLLVVLLAVSTQARRHRRALERRQRVEPRSE